MSNRYVWERQRLVGDSLKKTASQISVDGPGADFLEYVPEPGLPSESEYYISATNRPLLFSVDRETIGLQIAQGKEVLQEEVSIPANCVFFLNDYSETWSSTPIIWSETNLPGYTSYDAERPSLQAYIAGANGATVRSYIRGGQFYVRQQISGAHILQAYMHLDGNKAQLSNSSASAYPQTGFSNYANHKDEYYDYQGQDVIDAEAVGYSNQAPMGGQLITINVTPRTPTYGGTIRYTYQVQLSGGAWTTISSNNTATSLQYTIPAGTTSFAARVLASDTWGFSSSDYTTGATLTVTNNLPPTAPDGITIGDVLGGQQCTITWGAATDSDGTIDHYELERQVDNGDTWTQIFSGNALTYSDTINSEWATVNYRVRAVDDDAEPGPYTTGTMQTVNAGWLYFSGPAADMGDKPAPFDFVFSIGSTTPGVTDISVEVLLDDEIIYTGTPDAAEQVSVHIDTRLMFAGEHVLVITAEKQNLLGLDQECTFNIPAVTLPDGGRMVQLYNDEGQPVFPLTLGRAVIGKGGEDINEILDRVFSGTYTGTGTSGSQNPCQLRLSFVPRFLFVYSNAPASGWWVRTADATTSAQGTMETTGGKATVMWDNDNMVLSWYASSAAVQLNTSGTTYGYLVIG